MADKPISDLTAATQINALDLFVLQQDGTAKKLTGQILMNWLVSFADGHGGIQSLTKTDTNGLTDTYTVTLSDTTTFSFTVTNGKGIAAVTKTATAGLVDTYTVSYNDGTSTTFPVTNGKGIASWEKSGSEGLVDTYTVTYNDGTASTFQVTNGKGIASWEKTDSQDLEDTYLVTYNDGTTFSYSVKNGEKGDTGDNAYTHIKYASQEPSEEASSIGDVPDRWMGVYTGTAETAPADYSAYRWYEIKGKKGDTGDQSEVVSQEVAFQVSDSGTIYPSGAWSQQIPVVPQGKYLWTRSTVVFNSGAPQVSYSVARFGLDGLGSVSSVNNVSPDSGGNVSLTAGDVEALPISGGSMTGPVYMDGQKLSGLNAPTDQDEAATKGYVDTNYVPQARKVNGKALGEDVVLTAADVGEVNPNLLDNWYFPNPVNQRGQLSYATAGSYTIDRWILSNGGNTSASTVTLSNNGITINGTGVWNGYLLQFVESPERFNGKVLTVSALTRSSTVRRRLIMRINDTEFNKDIHVGEQLTFFTVNAPENITKLEVSLINSDTGSTSYEAVKLELGDCQTLAHQDENGNWVLNEVPNFAEQLARCKRYYQTGSCGGTARNNGWYYVTFPVEMRTNPAVTITDKFCFANNSDGIEVNTYGQYIVPSACWFRGFRMANSFHPGFVTYGGEWTATADL